VSRSASTTVLLCLVVSAVSTVSTACTAQSGHEHVAQPSPTLNIGAPTVFDRGLRGVPIKHDSCPAPGPATTENPRPTKRIDHPDAFVICATKGMAVPYIRRGYLTFPQLRESLSNLDAKTSQTCGADRRGIPLSVVAETRRGSYHVHLPEDSCSRYQRAVRRAVLTSWPEG
jgi:hypothetical protein